VSGGFSNPIIGGGGALVYPAIHSPNYVLNVTGWAIRKDGTAQFTGLVLIGGSFTGTNWIWNASGLFFYSGTPSLGNNPIAYIANPATTTDPEGNTLPVTGGGFVTVMGQVFAQLVNGAVIFGNSSSPFAAPPQIMSVGPGSAGAQLALLSGKGSTGTVQAVLALDDDQWAGTPGVGLALVKLSRVMRLSLAGGLGTITGWGDRKSGRARRSSAT
jgi:hypothetical protein